MSCRQHGYPWPSLAISPYHSSLPAGLQVYILCLHIAAVCKFELVVLLLLGHMWGSIGVHHLRARPCFSSSVRRVWTTTIMISITTVHIRIQNTNTGGFCYLGTNGLLITWLQFFDTRGTQFWKVFRIILC